MERAPTVHVDESGNSGENLLDPAQPVFVLAAVHLEDDVAERLVAGLAGGADEAHYTKLRKRPKGQRRLLELFADPALDSSTVRLSALHKPFMVEAKFVDLLFEPVMAAAGYDLYADGRHRELSDMFHALGRQATPTYWTPLMRAFVEFVWRGSAARARSFTKLLEAAVQESAGNPVGEFLAMIPRDPQLLVSWHGRDPSEPPADALDPALAAAVEQISRWGERLGPFLMVYDESKLMQRWSDRLLALSDPAVALEYTVTPTNKMSALPLAGLSPATSHESPAVQVADALAGAAADLLRSIVRGDSLTEWQLALREARILRFVDHYVWPHDNAMAEELVAQGILDVHEMDSSSI